MYETRIIFSTGALGFMTMSLAGEVGRVARDRVGEVGPIPIFVDPSLPRNQIIFEKDGAEVGRIVAGDPVTWGR